MTRRGTALPALRREQPSTEIQRQAPPHDGNPADSYHRPQGLPSDTITRRKGRR